MNKKKLIGNFFLLMTALIWGLAFVAQRVGMDYVGPLTFTAVRFWLGAAVLIPILFLMNRTNIKQDDSSVDDEGTTSSLSDETPKKRKSLLVAGGVCGTVLFIASIFQQFGLVFTTAGKAGFITRYKNSSALHFRSAETAPGNPVLIGVICGGGPLFSHYYKSLTIVPGIS